MSHPLFYFKKKPIFFIEEVTPLTTVSRYAESDGPRPDEHVETILKKMPTVPGNNQFRSVSDIREYYETHKQDTDNDNGNNQLLANIYTVLAYILITNSMINQHSEIAKGGKRKSRIKKSKSQKKHKSRKNRRKSNRRR